MKHLLFPFAILFGVSACNSPNFAPIADKPPEENQKGNYKQRIPSVVESEMKKEVGGKDRKTINLKKFKKTVIERMMEKIVVKGGEKDSLSGKKLDLLFYMDDRDTNCLRNVVSYFEDKGFLKFLNHLDWQVSFSYFTQGSDFAMIPLEWNNGQPVNTSDSFWRFKPGYVLSKGKYSQRKADRLFNTTLKAFHPEAEGPDETPPSSMGFNTNFKLFQAVSDPLSGLDHILSKKTKGAVRSGSHVVVLVFGYYGFHLHSFTEWSNFFRKHENVSVIAMSSLSSSAHILENEGYDYEFLAACSSPGQIIQAIKNKVR